MTTIHTVKCRMKLKAYCGECTCPVNLKKAVAPWSYHCNRKINITSNLRVLSIHVLVCCDYLVAVNFHIQCSWWSYVDIISLEPKFLDSYKHFDSSMKFSTRYQQIWLSIKIPEGGCQPAESRDFSSPQNLSGGANFFNLS